MKNKIKAFLFDIDDTLYSHQLHAVPELTKYTIKKLKEKGMILGLCSSRFPREFYSLPENLFDDFDLVIADTGGIVLKDHQIIHMETMRKEDIEQYIHYLDKQKNMFYLWVPVEGQPHFSKEPSEHLRQHNINWSGYCPTIQQYQGEALTNILFFNANEIQMKEIIEMCGRESVENWTDSGHINPKNVNKASGLKYFCDYFQLSTDEVVCFGDGRNDITMIETAGIGVAVGNSHEKLKQFADYICDPIENGGIYTFCTEYHFIDSIDSKLFFFDIDGTSFHWKKRKILDSTWLALKSLKERGHKIFICTSRSREEMVNLPKEFLDMFDGIICLAGGHIIIDGKNYFNSIDQNDIKRAVQVFDEHKIPYRYVDAQGHGFLYNSNEFVRSLFIDEYQMCPQEKKYEDESIVHMTYYLVKGEAQNSMNSIFLNSTVTHLRFSHEVTQLNMDKGQAIEYVANLYGYSIEHTVAFGDGNNDIPMLKRACIGIAMGNANDLVKANADYVTDTIDEDGLYNACKQFKWI